MMARTAGAALILAATVIHGATAAAQTSRPDGAPGNGVPKPEAASEAVPDLERGKRLGDFYLDLGASLGVAYDDNVFQSKTDTRDDWIMVFAPSLSLTSDWSEHALSLRAGADVGRYATNESEDYEDLFAGVSGRYDVSTDTNLFAGLDAARAHEVRGSPDLPGGAEEPTTYARYRGLSGISTRFGDIGVRAGVTGQRLDFQDTDRVGGGMLNNDDRDRNQYEFGGRISYRLDPVWQPFVQGAYDLRDYDDPRDDFGFARSSAGYTTAAGSRVRLGQGITGEVLLGYMSQDYDDTRFATVEGWDASARLDAQLTQRTRVTGYFDRSIGETTLPGSPASIDTQVGGRISHRLAPRWTVGLPAYHVRAEYQEVDRIDDTSGLGLALGYRLTPNVTLQGRYSFERRESTLPSADYDDNRFMLGLEARLARARQPLLPSYDDQGMYAGLQAGHAVLGSEVAGSRGPLGSTDTVVNEQAAQGAVGGGFLGYATTLDRWVLGAELEVDAANAEWDHDRMPQGRDFGMERGLSYGGAVRVGYRTAPVSLVYGRLGLVNTEFRHRYNDPSGDVITTDEDHIGLRFGGGVELDMTDRWFWRFDYTYTAYEDAAISDNRGRFDRFDPDESLFRLGLGYRFFEPVPDGDDAPTFGKAQDVAGPYVGAQGGWGWLLTNNAGTDRGQAGQGSLRVDRGSDGPSGGLFAGYGTLFGPFYAGVEMDAAISNTEWEVDRLPDRRQYSLRKRQVYGASLRLGYLVGESALVYGRVGVELARFDFDYAFPGEGVDTRLDTTEPGIRVGGGVEVPLSERVFLRLDYGYTGYDSIEFSTEAGTERFDPSESVVMLGIGFRF